MSAVIARRWAGALCCASLLALAGRASAQSPDVIVYDIGVDGGNINDIHYWGQFNGIAAYSIATQSCNKGTAVLQWQSGSSVQHPVIGQNMFRLKDGRFEQIGQSWLKHGFCAVNETEAFCGPCNSTPCSTLGIGCADTYWATLNDGQGGQSKVNVNATTGVHVHGGSPTGNSAIRGRLQVQVADMDPVENTGAVYFIEGHYITADDAAAGASANNASWRKVTVSSVSSVSGGGNTIREQPAIFAWQDEDPNVIIRSVVNLESGGAKTNYYLGCNVTSLGGGMYHYEYALQNLNSDQSASSFTVPTNGSANISNIGFHDVDYHSGDPYDGTDWPGSHAAGQVSWATTPYATNANANAIRWGTMYNFRFDANVPPVMGNVEIGLFKPSMNTSITVPNVCVPQGKPHVPTLRGMQNPSSPSPTPQGPVQGG